MSTYINIFLYSVVTPLSSATLSHMPTTLTANAYEVTHSALGSL